MSEEAVVAESGDEESPASPHTVAISTKNMLGDLMSLVVDEIKALPDVWQKLGEREQEQVIDRVHRRMTSAVEACVYMIASEGFIRIRASVDSVAIKDGMKATLSLSKHDVHRHNLVDAQGSNVFIVLADSEAFSGGASRVKPDPDQGALVLDAVEKIGRQAGNDAGDANDQKAA